jgi:hypothetical protein
MNHGRLGDLSLKNITQKTPKKKKNKNKLPCFIDRWSPMPFNAQSHLVPLHLHTLQIVISGSKLILKKIDIYEKNFNQC